MPQETPKKQNRDYPLANTPEPLPLYLQTQVGIQAGRTALETLRERDSKSKAEKLAKEARERLYKTRSPKDMD